MREVSIENSDGKVLAIGFGGILALGIGVGALVKMGYEFGVNQSRRILRRHDKDVRRMDKREKKWAKALKKSKKESEKGP